MPLHLLGKKSWNVYNQDNIARVRQDEADARAREEEEERRMQEVDSERRLQLLKGVNPNPEPEEKATADPEAYRRDHKHQKQEQVPGQGQGRSRKRKRLAGEDDTEREIRYAIEDDATNASNPSKDKASNHRKDDRRVANDAPIVDSTGHINLIPLPTEPIINGQRHEKNAEAEAEKALKKRSYEDQYTMRFSNAAGNKQSIGAKPWYSTTTQSNKLSAGKDVDIWGSSTSDPRRRSRDQARISLHDPLALMKKGVKQLKDAEKKRREWNEERQRDLEDLKDLEEMEHESRTKHRDQHHHRRRRRHHRRRREEDEEEEEKDLENFSLDSAAKERQRHHHHHHHSRSPEIRTHSSSDRPHRHHHHHHRSRHRSPTRIHTSK